MTELCHLTCTFPAGVQQGVALPSYFNFHIANRCPFWGFFYATVLYICTVMCLTKEIPAWDRLLSGTSDDAVLGMSSVLITIYSIRWL